MGGQRMPSSVRLAATLLVLAAAVRGLPDPDVRMRPSPPPSRPSTPPRRLTIDGHRLLDPEGRELRLTGFNWNAISVAPYEGDGRIMQRTLPGVNLARIVGIKWGNDCPLDGRGAPCTPNPTVVRGAERPLALVCF